MILEAALLTYQSLRFGRRDERQGHPWRRNAWWVPLRPRSCGLSFNFKGGRRGFAALQLDDQYTVRRALERARKQLSIAERATLLFKNPETKQFERTELTRADLEAATQTLVGRTLDLCQEAITAAKRNGVERIDDVIMSGGVTFMPLVRKRVRDLFFADRPDKQIALPPNPSVLVTHGAAIYAGMLMGRIPYTRVGERVAPYSYGISALQGYPNDGKLYMSVLIGRDDKLFDWNGQPQTFPARDFLTSNDNQKELSCNLLQANIQKSERRLAEQCTAIGSFVIAIEQHSAREMDFGSCSRSTRTGF